MERAPESSSSFVKEARIAFEYSLSNFIWKQAVFFAERLVAECPCEEMNYLLALAYFHNQETSRAHWHLQGSRSPEARYLLARCCLLLQKLEEGEDALIVGPASCNGNVGEVVNGAAGLFLLGQIREKQSMREQAVECYAKCLELSPFMWEAYERWSWLIHGSSTAKRASASGMAVKTFTDERLSQSFGVLAGPAGLLPDATPSHSTASQRASLERAGPHAVPAAVVARSQNVAPRNDREPPHHSGLLRKDRRGTADAPGRPGAPVNCTGVAGAQPRDARDLAHGKKQVLGAGVDLCNGGLDSAGEASLACLLGRLGTALHAMHGFDTSQAIQLLGGLPRTHYETGYVLDMVALCHMESNEYTKAEQVFQQVRRIEPRRVEGLEFYSTTLWHLGRDLELGHLAQQCLQWDQMRPQVWCVVGNCFSRQKEHDTAIKFFKRAIQVDSSFTYAYTLCGHEFVANEKFDKAVPMYEHAVGIDPRHYNAWWGLGNIYHRQEEHDSARAHFTKALEINKSNSVLRCYLGMVLDSLNEPHMALQNFDRAVQIEPHNGMAYFHKGCVLMSLERYDEALAALMEVIGLAPKDAAVHFQIGKVYMKLQQDQNALIHFNTAMDLNRDSKDYHTIKTHIEQLHIRGVRDVEADVVARRSTRRAQAMPPPPRGAGASPSSVQFFPGAAVGAHPHTGHSAAGMLQAGGSPQQIRAIHWHSGAPAPAHPGSSPIRRGAAEALPAPGPAGAGPRAPVAARGDAGPYAAARGRGLWGGAGRGSTPPGAAVHAPAGRGAPGPAAPTPGQSPNYHI